jgi:Mn2+/Fe2+ NRAMP family transporter
VPKLRTTPSQAASGLTPHHGVREFLRDLGPGLITGAADDDPSGISTYSVAGASYGYATLWTALLSFPLMAAIQLMCARLGMVTGCGLASVIRTRYSRWVLWLACALVVVANVFNIGADLGGMAEGMQMITGTPAYCWTLFFAVLIMGLLFWTSYRTMARVFKWLTLVLFAYVITAFLVHPNWTSVLRATFIPHIEWTKGYLAVLVGILGTTISPYLFFWQAAHALVVGILCLQPSGNLLRRPVQHQLTRNHLPQLAVPGQKTLLRPQRRLPGLLIRIEGAIGRTATMARASGTREAK